MELNKEQIDTIIAALQAIQPLLKMNSRYGSDTTKAVFDEQYYYYQEIIDTLKGASNAK